MSARNPNGDPINVDHLKQMTLGDAGLETEILTLFSSQAADLLGKLAALPPDAAGLAHKLKGSARAVGAFDVAKAVENVERVMRDGGTLSEPLTALTQAVAQVRRAIEVRLRRT